MATSCFSLGRPARHVPTTQALAHICTVSSQQPLTLSAQGCTAAFALPPPQRLGRSIPRLFAQVRQSNCQPHCLLELLLMVCRGVFRLLHPLRPRWPFPAAPPLTHCEPALPHRGSPGCSCLSSPWAAPAKLGCWMGGVGFGWGSACVVQRLPQNALDCPIRVAGACPHPSGICQAKGLFVVFFFAQLCASLVSQCHWPGVWPCHIQPQPPSPSIPPPLPLPPHSHRLSSSLRWCPSPSFRRWLGDGFAWGSHRPQPSTVASQDGLMLCCALEWFSDHPEHWWFAHDQGMYFHICHFYIVPHPLAYTHVLSHFVAAVEDPFE
eukprot:GGOE01030990.1.p1 GENE.GGOE01030990.1~~GGOE01030990.1.p1  ORF type:complete len:322 (-),score=-0.88 GGOE01030990.1:42-1007(-)